MNVRIAGEPRTHYEDVVAASELPTLEIEVELLIDGRVSSSLTATFDCDRGCGESEWDRVSVSFCALESGELRYSSTSCSGPNSECTADGFCAARCGPCGVGEKCGLARVPWSNEHGWLACVPLGSRGNAEACSVSADGFDDCASSLHCYEGACRPACLHLCSTPTCPDTTDCPGASCTQIPLASPGVGVCL